MMMMTVGLLLLVVEVANCNPINAPPMKAIISEYNFEGHWQSEETLTVKQVGISRTFLEPGKEYEITIGSTELGPNREVQFQRSCKGKVLVDRDDAIDLAVKGGAVAILTNRSFNSSKAKKLYGIPVFTTSENWSFFARMSMIKFRVEDDEQNELSEDNTTSNHQGELSEKKECEDTSSVSSNDESSAAVSLATSISTWMKAKRTPPFVIQQLKLNGVETIEDAAYMYVMQQEQEMLIAEEERLAEEERRLQNKDGAPANETNKNLFPANFLLKDIGVGGLGEEIEIMFRRTFASRMWSVEKLEMMGINHVRGLLLYGPPGCGKTLIARQLSKVLNAGKTTIISGSEVFSKWFGQSEQNVRTLFEDAEAEWDEKGYKSSLHVIIIDEIDAMCASRTGDGGGGNRATNSVVNQLLSKIDGVESINNILLIGMTNRRDAIDPALLRPGRFEVQLEIKLPRSDEARLEILNIHTQKLRDNDIMDSSTAARLIDVAKITGGFSGSDLEGVVKAACSFAMERCMLDEDGNLSLTPDESKLKVEYGDLERSLKETNKHYDDTTHQTMNRKWVVVVVLGISFVLLGQCVVSCNQA